MTFKSMRARPAVSVLIPCFNAEKYLDVALDSILSQALGSFEVVAIDDGSSDGTSSILARHSAADSRVRVHTLSRNGGLISALNMGQALCKGEYVARMDSDDVAHPERLKAQFGFLEKNPEFAGVGTWIQMIDGDGSLGSVKQYPGWDEIKRSPYATGSVGSSPFAHPTMMLRKRVLDEVGWYRPAFQHAEDADLWRRILDAGFSLNNLEQVLLSYRWHGENVTATSAEVQAASSLRAALSQRMRLAGLVDPFNGSSGSPLNRIVDNWDDFPRDIRGPIRAVWLQKNMVRLLDEDPELLVDELVETVADAGWNRRFGRVIGSALTASLQRGDFRRTLDCTLLILRHARSEVLDRVGEALRSGTKTGFRAERNENSFGRDGDLTIDRGRSR